MKNIQYGTEFLDQLKDRVHDLYDENVKLKEEIERLNNIINELEKYCKEMAHIEENELIAMNDFEEVYIDVLEKIKELKGSDKE